MKKKVNISIDDISPHPRSSVKVLDRCYELIKVFPDIKFTLFVPLNYNRLNERPLPISKYEGFCDILRNLSWDNFEVGIHGYRHGIVPNDNPTNSILSNNDEFKYLNYDQAMEKFDLIKEEIKKAKLVNVFKPIFRPRFRPRFRPKL